MLQLGEERKKNAERDADLPTVLGGSLGSFKNGLQTLPLKVTKVVGVGLCSMYCVGCLVGRSDPDWIDLPAFSSYRQH